MGSETDRIDDGALLQWSARKAQPIVLLYVILVFAGFIMIAQFVLDSSTAVKALALAGVGAIVPLVPTVLHKAEYRLTKGEIQKKKPEKGGTAGFSAVVKLDEMDRIVPVRHGFKFFKPLDEPNPLKRFWKMHLSDAYSGEVQVEKVDRERVLAVMRSRGVPIA